MRILWAKDRVATPWKNGGGTTSEVIVFSPGAGFDDFGWRVSIAQVERSGPFSMFAGIDRHLAMLEGRVVLNIAGREPIELSPSSQPESFPGDVAINADVIDGPATDLNVMTRLTAFRATMTRRNVERKLSCDTAASATLAFPLARVTIGGFQLEKADAILPEPGDAITIAPATEFYWIEIFAT
jgi:uncharacterized protein